MSKVFKIINRFSEDIDFVIYSHEKDSRAIYRNFRIKLFDSINESGIVKVSDKDIIIGNESRFFSFYVDYPKIFDEKTLRQQVKIEISAKKARLNSEERQITSWIDEYLENDIYCNIDCLSPLETAANKFSSFLWRSNCRDRLSNEKKV